MTVITRRSLLTRLGVLAGTTVLNGAVSALGLVPSLATASPRTRLMRLTGARRSVVVIGAGIAGLASAYELSRAGYDVTVLEASFRAGGRNMTVRSGDVIDEVGNRQVVNFDDEPHLYFNCGPARLPAEHTEMMRYCRELGVALEVFINDNRNAWVHNSGAFGGRPVRAREYLTNVRGFLAELTQKNLDPTDLDLPVTEQDIENLRRFLRAYGDLDESGRYHGSERAGILGGGFVVEADEKTPLDRREILKSSHWFGTMHFGESLDQAAPMWQPVGGMDRIVTGFMKHVSDRVHLNAMVRKLRLSQSGVTVVYDHKGEQKTINADFCINTMPAWLLCGIDHNFPVEYARALGTVRRGALFKIGFQTTERFWEKERIYGGISWTDQPITQIWYPPHNIFGKDGVILGAYTFGPNAGRVFARMTPEQRLEEAIRQGEKVHPDYRKYIKNGISIPWYRMNHMLGCSARFARDAAHEDFVRLQQPAGRHYMAGDQISYHSGWQEGAVRAAWVAMAHIDRRVRVEMRAPMA